MDKSSVEGTLESFGDKADRMLSMEERANPSSPSESDMSDRSWKMERSTVGPTFFSGEKEGSSGPREDMGGVLPSLEFVTLVGLKLGRFLALLDLLETPVSTVDSLEVTRGDEIEIFFTGTESNN